jgi:hypothetical protein
MKGVCHPSVGESQAASEAGWQQVAGAGSWQAEHLLLGWRLQQLHVCVHQLVVLLCLQYYKAQLDKLPRNGSWSRCGRGSSVIFGDQLKVDDLETCSRSMAGTSWEAR